MKSYISNLFKFFGLALIKDATLQYLRVKLNDYHMFKRDLELLKNLPEASASKLIKYLDLSKSQLRQDLFVIAMCDFKVGGFFVEFGATNGITLSNTFLLEKYFDWNGILAEPANIWRDDLLRNRSALIENKCVWSNSGSKINFIETPNPELSTISCFELSDSHNRLGKSADEYSVITITLEDLLDKYNAPKLIDYLSIDTEGSEYEILKNFNFEKYSFSIITVEHNFTKNRDLIYDLLISNGYIRKYENLSSFDDWYIKL